MATLLPELLVTDPAALRAWLEEHHATSPGVRLVLTKKGGSETPITWASAVEELLCFGLIDGQARKRDEDSYTVRDELGYLPLPAEAASALSRSCQRYLKTSIILTSTKGSAHGVRSWATPPSPQPCSTGSDTAPSCSTSTATPTAYEPTTPEEKPYEPPPQAPANHYADPATR